MELSFKTAMLRSLCESGDVATFEVPEHVIGQLRHRIADLRAAQTVLDVFVGERLFRGEVGTVLEIKLETGWLLVLHSNHGRPMYNTSGGLDWGRVHRIQVVSVEQHDAD
jgi:hypothetical protein